jgi:hypothetical protein
MAQYPSPMEEDIRAHERVEDRTQPGRYAQIEDVLPKPVDLFLPEKWADADSVDLLIHFHGASYVAREAATRSERPLVLAVVNLGSGSSVYERPFLSDASFERLVAAVDEWIEPRMARIYLSSWSAGYGAVRAILRSEFDRIDGIILLDGLHTDYVPDRVTLHDGGALNTSKLEDFLSFARASIEDRKSMLITHSEIFPGTYASTTETASWIIGEAGLKREPVLRQGPIGMQLLSETKAGNLSILGFAGNTAPDHIDHYHGLPTFLETMLDESTTVPAQSPR